MDEDGTMSVFTASPKSKIIAVHMEALDHCRTTRNSLRAKADRSGISKSQLMISADGEKIDLSVPK